MNLDSDLRDEFLLFHEGPSRILISTDQPEAVQAVARKHAVEAPLVGATIEGGLVIRNRGRSLLDCGIERLKGLWGGALGKMLRG